MASTELTTQSGELFVSPAQPAAESSTSIISIIDKIASTPGLDVQKIEVLERLLAMQERVEDTRRRAEFNDSHRRVTSQMPQIDQNGRIEYRGKDGKPGSVVNYAKLEDIDLIIRPMYSAEGFSVKWDSKPILDGRRIETTGEFKHSSGHSETVSIAFPPDSSGGKSDIQAVAGAIAYGKRHLLKMFFNIVEKGKDMDGADLKTITEEQALDMQSALEEVGANKAAFLEFAGVKTVGDILAKDYQKALNAIESKRRGKR